MVNQPHHSQCVGQSWPEAAFLREIKTNDTWLWHTIHPKKKKQKKKTFLTTVVRDQQMTPNPAEWVSNMLFVFTYRGTKLPWAGSLPELEGWRRHCAVSVCDYHWLCGEESILSRVSTSAVHFNSLHVVMLVSTGKICGCCQEKRFIPSPICV